MYPYKLEGAMMQLKVVDLIRDVKMATNLEEASAWTSQVEIVEQALQVFDSMHSWDFLTGADVTLDTVALQPWVVLPEDFRDLEDVELSGDSPRWVEAVTRARMTQLRSYDTPLNTQYAGYYYCITQEIRAVGGGLESRLELFPAPSETAVGVFRIRYRRSLAVLASTSPDTAYVRVPPFCVPALRELVRLVAKGIEEADPEDGGAPLYQRYEGFRRSGLILDAMSADGASQPILGPLEGGAAEIATLDTHWWDTAIDQPS